MVGVWREMVVVGRLPGLERVSVRLGETSFDDWVLLPLEEPTPASPAEPSP